MSDRPRRIQLSRKRGWRMPPNTVRVDRSTPWGNPYRLDDRRFDAFPWGSTELAQACVDHYEQMCRKGCVTVPYTILEPEERGDKYRSVGAHTVPEVAPKYLGGKNLACWCRLCDRHSEHGKPLDEDCPDCAPCHVDPLGRFANTLQGDIHDVPSDT